MGLIKVMEFEAGSSKSGVSISQGETRGRVYFRVGMTDAAQNEFFGRAVDTTKEALAFTLTDDPKLSHLMGIRLVPRDHPEAITVKGSVRGSVFVKVAAWRPAKSKHPSVSLEVVNRQVQGGGISVKLPDWAKPAPDPKAAR